MHNADESVCTVSDLRLSDLILLRGMGSWSQCAWMAEARYGLTSKTFPLVVAPDLAPRLRPNYGKSPLSRPRPGFEC